eukprot:gene23280-26351_t
MPDMDRTVSRRSEPSSRTALMGEQPNPWDVLPPQDAMSRHRGGDRPSQTAHLKLFFNRLTVVRIFTDNSISPSPSLRQLPNHYAIRAGRNLPAKEFRYLRTVIVTAAVHRGFSY